jgi:hypothetical protein
MSELDRVFRSIVKENIGRISNALVMQVVEEISSDMIEGIAKEFNLHYEEVENHMLFATKRFEEKLKKERNNGD